MQLGKSPSLDNLPPVDDDEASPLVESELLDVYDTCRWLSDARSSSLPPHQLQERGESGRIITEEMRYLWSFDLWHESLYTDANSSGVEHFACRLRILAIFISASAQLSWVLLGFQRFSGSL